MAGPPGLHYVVRVAALEIVLDQTFLPWWARRVQSY